MERYWLHRFSILTAFATLFLIVAGALVTSTGSGLAVPDWPLSFGQFFPPMKGGVFYEHGHRMTAGTVGILMVILFTWLWLKEDRGWLRWLGAVALCSVILQAALGGITVLYQLPQSISIFHAILAQIFFGLTVSISFFTFPQNNKKGGRYFFNVSPQVHRFSIMTTALIFGQLILGAILRHSGKEKFLHLHILGAIIVSLGVLLLLITLWKQFKPKAEILAPSIIFMSLLFFQIFLGLISAFPGYFILINGNMEIALITMHVVGGALILSISLLFTLCSYKFNPPLTH